MAGGEIFCGIVLVNIVSGGKGHVFVGTVEFCLGFLVYFAVFHGGGAHLGAEILGQVGGVHKARQHGDFVQGQVGVDQVVGYLFNADAGEQLGKGGAGDVGDVLGQGGLGDEEGPRHAGQGELFGGVGVDVAEDGALGGDVPLIILFPAHRHDVAAVHNHQLDDLVGDV